jgi:hypothetical protein
MTTLRAALAEVYDRAALDDAGGQPSEEELRRALADATGKELSPQQAMLLLQATQAHSDLRAAALHLPAVSADDSSELADGTFTVERIEALTPALWRACLAWLLAGEGYAVEEVGRGEGSVIWRGQVDERRVIAHAVRLPRGWPLDEEVVQRAAALAAGEQGVEVLLIAGAMATVGALLVARRLNVHIWDRAQLREVVRRRATAYVRGQEEAQDLLHERVRAAIGARAALLGALHDVGQALAHGENARRASGRRAATEAARQVAAAKAELERAALAWETLAEEWSAAFGERATREGTLSIEADSAQLRELAERTAHLRQAALHGAEALARMPASGDSGYVAWRRAMLEALATRFEALRWRIAVIDPARWQDFAQAHDEEAAQRAARATTAANHAAARAEKAYAQLA